MSSRCRVAIVLTASLLALALFRAPSANALRDVGGKEPLKEGPWPDGCLEFANLPTRLAYTVGSYVSHTSNHIFYYRGETEDFKKALAVFAAIRTPALEIHLLDGPHKDSIVKQGEKDDNERVDWTFNVWNPEAWHAVYNSPEAGHRTGNFKPVQAPTLEVYAGAPGIDWAQIKVPDNIRVTDNRAAAQKKTAAGPMLRGVVYDMSNGKTIGGAKLEARKWAQTKWVTAAQTGADAAGAFKIDGIAPDTYQIIASAKGFAPRAFAYEKLSAETPLRIDAELGAEVTIRGTVADPGGQPLKGVTVRVEQTLGIDGRVYSGLDDAAAVTDDAGKFTFAKMPPGFASFSCQAAGFEMLNPRTLWNLASWWKITGHEILRTGEVPVALQMAVPGIIRCKVVTPEGKPVKDIVEIMIADAEGGYSRAYRRFQRTAPVQAEGVAELKGVPVGRYFVVEGYQVDSGVDVKTVTVVSGQTTETTVVARPRIQHATEPVLPPREKQPPKEPTKNEF